MIVIGLKAGGLVKGPEPHNALENSIKCIYYCSSKKTSGFYMTIYFDITTL